MNIEDFRFKSLAIEGYNGVSLSFLASIADFESSKLLKDQSLYTDFAGAPMLHHAITKLCGLTREQNIISRANIYDQIYLLEKKFGLEEIHVALGAKNIEEIYEFVGNHVKSNPQRQFWIKDQWKLDYSKLNYQNLIIISSLESLLGISAINYGWLVTSSHEIYNYLINLIDRARTCQSSLCEIYSLIALRNYNLISSMNMEVADRNRKFLLYHAGNLDIKWSNIIPMAEFAFDESQYSFENFRRKFSIYLLPPILGKIRIYFGHKNFPQDFIALLEAFSAAA